MNAESEPPSPESALAEIARIESLHGALGRRTSGLTWMIWGLVGPAIFVTYGLVGLLYTRDPGVAILFPFLWFPWTVLGVSATIFLWRSVGLVLPIDRTRSRREGLATGVLIIGLIFTGMALIGITGARVAEPAWALAALGIAGVVIGATGLNCYDSTDRRTWIVGGILMAVTAFLGTLLIDGDIGELRMWFTLIAPIACGLVFFGSGLYRVTRE